MATSQRTEQEPSVERALEEIADIEVEAEGGRQPIRRFRQPTDC